MATGRLSLALAYLVLASAPSLAAPPLSRETQVNAIIARYAASPPALRILLQPMPKGGDLHNHLDGSVYAEDYLKWASDDGFCVDKLTHALTPPPCSAAQVEARDLVSRDPKFYQDTIDALSMRNWYPGSGTGEATGHDHTFATFGRFGAVGARHLGDMLAATRVTAAADHVQYIEQIADPGAAFAPELLNGDARFDPTDLEADLKRIAPLLPGLVARARTEFDGAERTMQDDLGWHTDMASPGYRVRTHYLFFVLRTLPPQQVFAQIALGFALVKADPRFVGVNLVAPEDDPVSLRDFGLQMRMFHFFKQRDPEVKLSLHAGELALGLVPPIDLGFHIRDTVELAGASRIGHGYSIPYENGAANLLADMAQRRIAVEINLTSNDITPGIRGTEHPLALYRAAHVPVTLSADDEGVFRIDLTHEYVRAVTEQHLSYLDLKEIARNGLEYSFLPGKSLWLQGDYRRTTPACAGVPPGAAVTPPACKAFLAGSEKAALQWDFEFEVAAYENYVIAGPLARR